MIICASRIEGQKKEPFIQPILVGAAVAIVPSKKVMGNFNPEHCFISINTSRSQPDINITGLLQTDIWPALQGNRQMDSGLRILINGFGCKPVSCMKNCEPLSSVLLVIMLDLEPAGRTLPNSEEGNPHHLGQAGTKESVSKDSVPALGSHFA
jgi:hypothetical protein